MRIDGTLKKWNDERGFGFVLSNQGGQEIFVHVSAFGRIDRRPQLGEPLSFEIELDKAGRKRAIKVLRPGRPNPVRASRRGPERPGLLGKLIAPMLMLAIIIVLGAYAYGEYSRKPTTPLPASAAGPLTNAIPEPEPEPPARFQCDGRIHCSQMTSCAEATFFLKNCPGVKMDGDHDGVPCEEQWCTGRFAR